MACKTDPERWEVTLQETRTEWYSKYVCSEIIQCTDLPQIYYTESISQNKLAIADAIWARMPVNAVFISGKRV